MQGINDRLRADTVAEHEPVIVGGFKHHGLKMQRVSFRKKARVPLRRFRMLVTPVMSVMMVARVRAEIRPRSKRIDKYYVVSRVSSSPPIGRYSEEANRPTRGAAPARTENRIGIVAKKLTQAELTVPALKVNQWLADWEEVNFDGKISVPPQALLFHALSAGVAIEGGMTGVYRRSARPVSLAKGSQRTARPRGGTVPYYPAICAVRIPMVRNERFQPRGSGLGNTSKTRLAANCNYCEHFDRWRKTKQRSDWKAGPHDGPG